MIIRVGYFGSTNRVEINDLERVPRNGEYISVEIRGEKVYGRVENVYTSYKKKCDCDFKQIVNIELERIAKLCW